MQFNLRVWGFNLRSRYCRETFETDPDTIWIGLCEGDGDAIATCKTFLSDYVEHSIRSIMVLGPAEYEERRMLNSANSVLAMWRALVKEADLTVLKEKRQQEPKRSDKWRLRFHNYNARQPTSSIATFDISKVSSLLSAK